MAVISTGLNFMIVFCMILNYTQNLLYINHKTTILGPGCSNTGQGYPPDIAPGLSLSFEAAKANEDSPVTSHNTIYIVTLSVPL